MSCIHRYFSDLGDVMKISRLLTFLATIICYCPLSVAFEKAPDGVSYVQVRGGDPATPAVLDKKGKFTKKLVRDAEWVLPTRAGGNSWFSAIWKEVLHKPAGVCENRRAEIYKVSDGLLVVSQSKFHDASTDENGAPFCRESREKIMAPSLSYYVTGRWARDALKYPVVGAAGTATDPLCIENSMVRCPAANGREERFDTAKFTGVRSCGLAAPNCLILGLMFEDKLSEFSSGIEPLNFRVEYSRSSDGALKLEEYSFTKAEGGPPPLPGAPAIERSSKSVR